MLSAACGVTGNQVLSMLLRSQVFVLTPPVPSPDIDQPLSCQLWSPRELAISLLQINHLGHALMPMLKQILCDQIYQSRMRRRLHSYLWSLPSRRAELKTSRRMTQWSLKL
jgi:hypothetical protein